MRVIARGNGYVFRYFSCGEWEEKPVRVADCQPSKARVRDAREAVELADRLCGTSFNDGDKMYQVVVGDLVFLVITTQDGGVFWFPINTQLKAGLLENVCFGTIIWERKNVELPIPVSVAA